MIDIETLALDSKPVILSIGAITFDPYGDTVTFDPVYGQYYEILDPRQDGRYIDPATVNWWMNNAEAWPYTKPFDEYLFLEAGIGKLNEFIYDNAPEGIWSHGKDFDLAILREFGLQVDYHKFYDTRTVFWLIGGSSTVTVQIPDNFMKHHPLWDCWLQARQVQEALYIIRKGI